MNDYNHRTLAPTFLLLGLLATGVVQASSLNIMEPRMINPGDLLEQEITWQRDTNSRIEISLVAAPEGAYLDVGNDGQIMVHWQTGARLPSASVLSIQAHDVDSQELLDTQDLIVLNASLPVSAEPGQVQSEPRGRLRSQLLHSQPQSQPKIQPRGFFADQAGSQPPMMTSGQSSNVAAGFVNEPSLMDETLKVTLLAPKSQIMSLDDELSVSINGVSSDAKAPYLSIDRLPRNATFEENSLGSYTFYWQPRDADQGIHTFKLTATHPDNREVHDTGFFTVVVGDPSLSATQPANYR